MTTTTPTVAPAKRSWTLKGLIFSILGGAIALLLAGGELSHIMVPWTPLEHVHDPTVSVPVMHVWHYAQAGMHSLLLMALPLLVVALQPRRRPLVMQFLVLSSGLLAVMILPVRPVDTLVVVCGLGLLLAVYPEPRRLLKAPPLTGISYPILALTLACSPLLLGEAARLVIWQFQGVGGEHAVVGHWIAAATIPLALLLAGLGAATSAPGASTLGVIAGLSLVYLGAAAIALRGFDGSWGETGGAASLIVGVAYLLLTLWAVKRRGHAPPLRIQ